MKITLQARVRHFLTKNGPSTVDQVLAAVGKYVTAAQAMRAYERVSKSRVVKSRSAKAVEIGRRVVVRDAINNVLRGAA